MSIGICELLSICISIAGVNFSDSIAIITTGPFFEFVSYIVTLQINSNIAVVLICEYRIQYHEMMNMIFEAIAHPPKYKNTWRALTGANRLWIGSGHHRWQAISSGYYSHPERKSHLTPTLQNEPIVRRIGR